MRFTDIQPICLNPCDGRKLTVICPFSSNSLMNLNPRKTAGSSSGRDLRCTFILTYTGKLKSFGWVKAKFRIFVILRRWWHDALKQSRHLIDRLLQRFLFEINGGAAVVVRNFLAGVWSFTQTFARHGTVGEATCARAHVHTYESTNTRRGCGFTHNFTGTVVHTANGPKCKNIPAGPCKPPSTTSSILS